jgi:predicted DNA-binding WGR domain protein
VLTKDWYHTPDDVLARLEKMLQGQEIDSDPEPGEEEPVVGSSRCDDRSDGEVGSSVPRDRADEPTQQTQATPPPNPQLSTLNPQLPSASPLPAPCSNNPQLPPARYFEFIGGGSRKFWEISVSANAFTVRFGRIGTAGQTQSKTFPDEARARREAESLIAEKVRKGYAEKS